MCASKTQRFSQLNKTTDSDLDHFLSAPAHPGRAIVISTISPQQTKRIRQARRGFRICLIQGSLPTEKRSTPDKFRHRNWYASVKRCRVRFGSNTPVRSQGVDIRKGKMRLHKEGGNFLCGSWPRFTSADEASESNSLCFLDKPRGVETLKLAMHN